MKWLLMMDSGDFSKRAHVLSEMSLSDLVSSAHRDAHDSNVNIMERLRNDSLLTDVVETGIVSVVMEHAQHADDSKVVFVEDELGSGDCSDHITMIE